MPTPRLTTYWVESTDLLTSPYGYETCDFPTAVVREAAQLADANGVTYTGARYADAPFGVVHTVTGSGADDTAAGVAVLTRLYDAGATITLCEEGQAASRTTTIRSVASITADYMGDKFARVTVAGTRDPYWSGAAKTLTQVTNVALPSVYTVSGANVSGEVPAGLALRIRPEQATGAIWVGCRTEPSASASFTQDYDACAITTSAAYASVGTATTLNAEANAGRYRVVGRLQTSSGTSSTYRAASVATPAVGSSVTQYTTHVHETASATYEVLALGSVDVPSADVPSELMWLPESVITNASAANASAASIVRRAETFPLAASTAITGLTFRLSASATAQGFVSLRDTDACGVPTGPSISSLSYITVTSSAAADYRGSFSVPVELAPGTYAACVTFDLGQGVKAYYDSSAAYASGAHYSAGADAVYSACAGDMYFTVYGSTQAPSASAAVVVQAANASAVTVSLDTVALVPTDEWAVESTNTFAASAGILLDATPTRASDIDVMLVNASATGASLTASGTMVWGMPGLAPGVDSGLVIQAYTPGASAVSTATVDCEIHPRWLHRLGG